MLDLKALLFAGIITTTATTSGLCAADLKRLEAEGDAPYAEAVSVPPGYTTYYVSGQIATPQKPASGTKPAAWGDIGYQTKSLLDNAKATLNKLGLSFADVVQAHVFMASDPAHGGEANFAAMNKVWRTQFGTKEQPNKPARAAIKVESLAEPGPLVEIDFVAAKKVQ